MVLQELDLSNCFRTYVPSALHYPSPLDKVKFLGESLPPKPEVRFVLTDQITFEDFGSNNHWEPPQNCPNSSVPGGLNLGLQSLFSVHFL